MSVSSRRIEVAAAVILREDGRFLLAERPAGKVYAGYWEFPGGKVESGETAESALARELHEELGIEVDRIYPWITRDYDYAHAAVRLRFFRVVSWHGELHGREAQHFAWESAGGVRVSPLLPANGPVLHALDLPSIYGISNAAAMGEERFLACAERAFLKGLRLVQLREKSCAPIPLRHLGERLLTLARAHGARMLVNSDLELAHELNADGVHLTARQLAAFATRPDFALVGASCHDRMELEQAARLGVDFAVLGPVRATPSHPHTPALGWETFRTLIRDYPLPVYALGGMRAADLEHACQCGAHGISMLRGAW